VKLSPLRSVGASLGGLASAVGLSYSVYLTAIGASAARSLRRPSAPVPPSLTTRFRVLIPAHNEETMIKDTLAAASLLDYPADRFEIHVVADNCTDRTAEIARLCNVQTHERIAPDDPGKGPALSWLIDSLPSGEPSDVIVIIDADSIVEPSFLTALSAHFEQGAEVVQAYYAVRDESLGGEVGLRSAAFAVRHLVRPAGRVGLGGSSSLYGNGMAFTEEVARSFAWSAHLTEDLEMGLRLLLSGKSVGFEPDAVVRGEMPETRDSADSQHERWESGRRSVARSYVPKLANAAMKGVDNKRWPYIDAALDITMPPLGTLVATTGAGSALLALSGQGRARLIGVGGGGISLGLLMAHVVMSLRLAGAPVAVYRSLLRAPGNILWKLRLLWRTRGHQSNEWVRTARNIEVAR